MTVVGVHPILHPPASLCGECHLPLNNGQPVVAHEYGDNHPQHRNCLQESAASLEGRCRHCDYCIDFNSLFTLKEKMWRGAKAYCIHGLLGGAGAAVMRIAVPALTAAIAETATMAVATQANAAVTALTVATVVVIAEAKEGIFYTIQRAAVNRIQMVSEWINQKIHNRQLDPCAASIGMVCGGFVYIISSMKLPPSISSSYAWTLGVTAILGGEISGYWAVRRSLGY